MDLLCTRNMPDERETFNVCQDLEKQDAVEGEKVAFREITSLGPRRKLSIVFLAPSSFYESTANMQDPKDPLTVQH